jgi:hypothetical protein
VIIVLGQGKPNGMTLLSKTKSDEYFNGIACEFMSKSKKANKPSDASMVMKLEVELDQLQLKAVRDFYNDMGRVMDKYKVSKTDQELCMLMACTNQDTSYVQLILDRLKSNSPNFDRMHNNLSEIQTLTQTRSIG